MFNKLKQDFSHYRAKRISSFILPHLKCEQKVLDFGCGDLLVGKYIKDRLNLDLTGIDVIDMNRTNINFLKYNGVKIPFKDKSFDTTYSSFVFHHIKNIPKLLTECLRVTKKRLLILEDVPKNNLEMFISKMLDYSNLLLSNQMSIPLNFQSEKRWMKLLQQMNLNLVKAYDVRPNPIRPSRHIMFVVDL